MEINYDENFVSGNDTEEALALSAQKRSDAVTTLNEKLQDRFNEVENSDYIMVKLNWLDNRSWKIDGL